MRDGGSMGMCGGSQGLHDVAVLNCDISFMGGTLLDYDQNGDPVRFGNGIEFYDSSCTTYNCLVEGCSIWDIYDSGVTNQGANSTQYNITYCNNIIGNCEMAYEFWSTGTSSTSYIYFQNNTCVDSGYGWSHDQRPDPLGIDVRSEANGGTLNNVFIRNNIFCGAKIQAIDMCGEQNGLLANVTWDYNLYQTPSISWLGTEYDMQHFFGSTPGYYQYDTGKDAHSMVGWPQFVDPWDRDFHLLQTSPAIDVGTNTGVATDFDGTPGPRAPLTTSAPTNTGGW